jgi:hypothetical protein
MQAICFWERNYYGAIVSSLHNSNHNSPQMNVPKQRSGNSGERAGSACVAAVEQTPTKRPDRGGRLQEAKNVE